MKLGWVVVLVIACKGKGGAPAAGSGSAPAPAGDAQIVIASDAAVAPSAKLEIDTANDAIELQLAFDNQRHPRTNSRSGGARCRFLARDRRAPASVARDLPDLDRAVSCARHRLARTRARSTMEV